MQIVLASASPQRTRILTQLGIPHIVEPSLYDESLCLQLLPAKRAEVLAIAKAQEVFTRMGNAFIIGSDTTVESSTGVLFEKPHDALQARAMLESYNNSYCFVHSGLCIIAPDGAIAHGVCTTKIDFSVISSEFIQWWISQNIWQNKSGGFQIDGPGELIITKITGEYSSVVGLPVALLNTLFTQHQIDITQYIENT